MTLVCCNAVFSEILGVSEVDNESILLLLSIVEGVKQALFLDISVPFLVELKYSQEWRRTYLYRLFVCLFLVPKRSM